MKKHKRISNKFEWVPPEKRASRFPGPLPPRKPETRIPLFYFARDGDDVYFVNNSTETLNSVTSNSGGLQTLDDESMSVGGPTYSYKDVKPGEAVKVENYDPVYDSDYLLQLDVEISSMTQGVKLFRVHEKGGVRETVLLWDTGEAGKYVYMQERT